MTGSHIKNEVSPDWAFDSDLLPVVLTGYIQTSSSCALPEAVFDIEKCSPYGSIIDYTYPKIYSPVQYISPLATTIHPLPSPSPPPPPSSPKPSDFTAHVCEKKKRTPTSYDKETSHYLKSVFFDVYSKQKKLTKVQRLAVRNKTGLPSRNVTYWFSNHKRRFKKALEVYKATVENSHGKITCYNDFVLWRRSHNLPDDVTRSEMENI